MTNLTYADDTIGWYAILTMPQREKRVVEWMAQFGVYTFYPVYRKWRVRRRVTKVPKAKTLPDGRAGYYDEKTLLPGYVFAKFSGPPRWHIIREMPHISGVLGHNGKPVCLSYDDLETLHEMRKRHADEAETEEKQAPIVFNPGDQVRITEIPSLEGFVREITAVDAAKEVVYLRDLAILGHQLPVKMANLVML